MSTTEYVALPDQERDDIRVAAHAAAARAEARYAALLSAEAGLAARAVFPDAARLVFALTDDLAGASASLIAAYGGAGQRLWHVDDGDEWPDESLVTDRLAAAWDAYRGDNFPPARDDGDLFELILTDALTPDRVMPGPAETTGSNHGTQTGAAGRPDRGV